MDIGETISNSVKYPLSDFKKLLILGIIMIIPIINFIGVGYYLRAIKSNLASIYELPSFDDVGELFIDGLKVFVVNIVYALVPLIIMGIGWAVLFLGGAGSFSYDYYYNTYTYADPFMFTVAMVLFIIAGLISIVIAPFILMAIANMAFYDGKLGAAFNFSEIIGRIKSVGWGEFIIWYIVLIIVLFVLGIVIGILGFIFFLLVFVIIGIPLLLLLFIVAAPYIQLFQAKYIAEFFTTTEY